MYFPYISSQIQDPLVLLDPVCLRETLLEWLLVLERVLGPGEERWDRDYLQSCSEHEESCCSPREPAENTTEEEEKEDFHELQGKEEEECEGSDGSPQEPVRVVSPKAIQLDLLANLTQLATLYTELSCFRKPESEQALGCTTFLRRYFFLLDKERVRRLCLLCYQEQPEVQRSFTEAMLGVTLLLKSIIYVTFCLCF